MTRLVPRREPVRRFTAFLVNRTQFEFESVLRLAWSKAEKLAHGVEVQRVEGHGPFWHYFEERS